MEVNDEQDRKSIIFMGTAKGIGLLNLLFNITKQAI